VGAFLFGEEHPYGRYSRKEKMEALKREDVLSFYKECYRLDNVKIFMGGKVGGEEVKAINAVFGQIDITQSIPEKKQYPITPATERKHRIANDPNGVQGAIRIGREFPNRHHPDYTPMVVLNTLFGGYFGSRLMSNIREEKGFTYGIYSSLSPEVSGGSLVIQTETGTAVIEQAVTEVYREMSILCNTLPSDEELLLVKNYLLGGLLGDLDGPFSILQRWRSLILNGFTEAQFYNNVHIYKTITPAELQALAQKYFDPKDFYELVVV
jgi:zinc protease